MASTLTSLATTAKPRPASPVRAASMVALRANRLVEGDAGDLFCRTAYPLCLERQFLNGKVCVRAQPSGRPGCRRSLRDNIIDLLHTSTQPIQIYLDGTCFMSRLQEGPLGQRRLLICLRCISRDDTSCFLHRARCDLGLLNEPVHSIVEPLH